MGINNVRFLFRMAWVHNGKVWDRPVQGHLALFKFGGGGRRAPSEFVPSSRRPGPHERVQRPGTGQLGQNFSAHQDTT